MRKSIRLGLLGTAGIAALALAAVALAAYSPLLAVDTGSDLAAGTSNTDILFLQTNSDDPTALVAIFAPSQVTATLNQAAGTQIGTIDGIALAGALGNAIVSVTGTVVVGDPTNSALMAAAMQCTHVATHHAIWLLNVQANGQSLPAPVPLYVDPLVPDKTSVPGDAFASTEIQLCLPHPSLATFKIKLLLATLHISGVFNPPATGGSYRWTALNIPWDPTTPTVNPAGTVETQSIARLPVQVAFNTKRLTKKRKVHHRKHLDIFYSYSARVSGNVVAGGEGAAGANVYIFAGKKKVATVTTNSNGTFSKTFKLAKTTIYHAVVEDVSHELVGATCQPQLPIPGTSIPAACGTITEGGFSATTKNATVKKPKLKRTHIR